VDLLRAVGYCEKIGVAMISRVLLYVGSAFILFWGVAHLFPTRSVVRGFGDISLDNKRIIAMEWIIEGISLIFIAAVIITVTFIDRTSIISRTIYWICFIMLNVLSVVSLMTGFKVRLLPFKLCPVIFTTASILILLGNYL
jgi:hypothetical protein